MSLFPLAIFPEGSLSSSVIPVVWVGMAWVCFFNLRLGWVLSGLVVPGYLVPLILIKPWAAAVVLFESVLTYYIVWFISEYLSRWAPWCNFFGRDRFFALVLASIGVRLTFDGWLLPVFGEWATGYWHIAFDYRNNLHSFGLIIISLVANQFWKTGFLKGSIPLVVTLGLTLLVVRYGLMELTNFNLSSINYLYEDMASSILASPKAYIIIIMTAFMASRMNLYYGWDFNGILIPSLLALQWYQPIKIVATLIESCIILGLSILLLKTPFLSKMTIEGARKLLLFFNASFAYKILLGYSILYILPAEKITDYFGFGYLLSTLIAVKIHDKGIFARLTRATLQTSLTAVAAASLIGYLLTLLPITKIVAGPAAVADLAALATPVASNHEDLTKLLNQEQLELYQNKISDKFVPPSAREIEDFENALSKLKNYLKKPDSRLLREASELLNQVNFRLESVNSGRYLYIHEMLPLKGWGAYVLDTRAASDLALEIPAPLDEDGAFDAGVSLFNGFGAKSLAISGSRRLVNGDVSGDVLKNPSVFFHVFHRLFNPRNSLQLRVYSDELARKISGLRRNKEVIEAEGLRSSLWIKQRLPDDLDLPKLKKILAYDINWNAPPFENQQRELSRYGFAELVLTKEDLRKLTFKSSLLTQSNSIVAIEKTLGIEGYLREWILKQKQTIAPKGSQLYKIPKQVELLYFDEQVLTPLLKIIRDSEQSKADDAIDNDILQAIAQAADIIGYRVMRYRDRLSHQDYIILSEQDDEHPKYWGLYVFKIGVANRYAVQIPRPLYEVNSFEYGVALFERLDAQVLMIGTTHPGANADGSADLINPDNKLSVFNLVNQALMRESNDEQFMLLSIRAFSYRSDRAYPDADVVFALADGVVTREQMNPLAQELLNKLESDGMEVQLIDGSEQTSGYEVGSTAQSVYLEMASNKTFAVLWLSPGIRSSYRQQSENLLQAAQFNSLNIVSQEHDLGTFLQQQHAFSSNTAVEKDFRDLIVRYVKEQDVLRLQQIIASASDKGYLLMRVIDRNSKQAFFVIRDRSDRPFALVNLSARSEEIAIVDGNLPLTGQVRDFIDQRKMWLLR